MAGACLGLCAAMLGEYRVGPLSQLGDSSSRQNFPHRVVVVAELIERNDTGLVFTRFLEVGLDGAPPLGNRWGFDPTSSRRIVVEGRQKVYDDGLLCRREFPVPENVEADFAFEQGAVVVGQSDRRRLVETEKVSCGGRSAIKA